MATPAPSPFESEHRSSKAEITPLLILLLAAALLIAFVKIASEIVQGDLIGMDRSILLALRHPEDLSKPLGPVWLQIAARDVTSLGSPAILATLTLSALGFLLLKRKRAAAALLAASVVGGSIVSNLLKGFIERPRPDFVAEVAQTQTFSFPSGHAFLSAVTFLTIGVLLARVERQREVKIYLLSVSIALSLIVGLSRLYLGVHWPTDVLAGWCAGVGWALLCWLAAFWLQAQNRSGNGDGLLL